MWYLFQYVCRYQSYHPVLASSPTSRFIQISYRSYYLSFLRLILWDRLSAIPLTYWIVESITLSNGLSLLFFLFSWYLTDIWSISRNPSFNKSFLLCFQKPFLVRFFFWTESQIESERGVADAGRTVTSDLDRMWRYLYPEFDLFVKKRIFYRSDRSGCRREKRNGATSQSDQTMGWSGRREWLRQDVQDTFIEKDEVYQIVLSRTALCRRKRNVERGSGKGSRRHTRSIDGSLCRREKIS